MSTRGFWPSQWKRSAARFRDLEAIGPVVVTVGDLDSDGSAGGGFVEHESVPSAAVVGNSESGAELSRPPLHRRGKLAWPKGKGKRRGKMRAIVEWLWVWLK